MTVLGDGIDEVAAKSFDGGKVGDFTRAELLREGKFGAGAEPVREVIARAVIRDRVVGDFAEELFEFVHVARASYFGQVGHPEDEVAEAKLLGEEAAKIVEQRGRTLAQERAAFFDSARLERGSAGLEDDGRVGNDGANFVGEREAGFGSERAVARELDVGDDAEEIFAILRDERFGLLVIRAEENLGTRAEANEFVGVVEAFGDETSRLGVEIGLD